MIILLDLVKRMPRISVSGDKDQAGFSLMELLIALAIFSIVVGGIVAARLGQQGQHMSQNQAVEMQQAVRATMYLMTREIRMAGFNPHQDDYNEGVTNAGDGSSSADPFTFAYVADDDNNDNDSDGTVDQTGELKTCSYYLDSTGIIRLDHLNGGGAQILAENIAALNFNFLDKDNNPTANLDDIRAVRLIIKTTTGSNELAYSDETYVANNDGHDNDMDGVVDEFDEMESLNTRILETTIKCRNLGI